MCAIFQKDWSEQEREDIRKEKRDKRKKDLNSTPDDITSSG